MNHENKKLKIKRLNKRHNIFPRYGWKNEHSSVKVIKIFI